MLDVLGKGFVVLAVALSASWLLRRASAAQRHLVWLCAVAVLLALPITAGWRGSAVPSAASKKHEGAALIVRIPASVIVEPSSLPTAPVAAASFGRQMRRWAVGLGWRGALVGLWAGGVLAGLAGHSLTRMRLIRLIRRSRALADPSLLAVADGLAREAGVRRRVAWCVGEDLPVAMTWGWWRPVVLLPGGAPAWSRERLELVLRHELAHVARRDSFTRGLAGIACVLHWPNPLVWLAARGLRLTQEQACDDVVLAAGASAEAYAEELLAAARAWGGRTPCGAAMAMAEPSTLERRILGVLGVARRDRVSRSVTVGAWVAAGCVLAGCSTVKVGEQAAAPASVATEVRPLKAGEPVSLPGEPISKGRRGDTRQIEVEVRFVELKGADAEGFDAKTFFGAALTPGATTSAAVLGHLSKDEAARAIRELATRYNSNTLSAPKVTVMNQSRATITVARELRYPSTFDAAPVKIEEAKPGDYETRNVGVEASVLPNILLDGSVTVDIQTMVREFEGFVFAPDVASGMRVGDVPAGVFVPVFVERADAAAVLLRPGQVAVLRASEKKKVLPEKAPEWARKSMPPAAAADKEPTGPVLIFVSARESR